MRCRGLNLVEVLVAVCLIAVLAAVSLPMLSQANSGARSAACRANLMTLGHALADYQQSHGTLPALMNRNDRALDVPTIDTFLTLSNPQRSALHCPGDDTGTFERTGTSYVWLAPWGPSTQQLTGDNAWLNAPILSDKAPFHTDQQLPYNALFQNDRTDTDAAPPFIAAPYAGLYQ
ncbi:MAG: type II secretion system protein [Planctomycetota bacterium]